MATDRDPVSPAEPPNWGRRALIAVFAVIGAVLVYLIGAAVIPRWWAQRVGDFVDGRLSVGATLGAFLGIVFTLLPLVVLWAALRFRRGWRRWLGFLVAAVLLATPNLMTLGIVVGRGNAAHAGERILDVEGPGFRGGTLVGVVLGVLIGAVFAYLVLSRRSSRRRVDRLQDERRAATTSASADVPTEDAPAVSGRSNPPTGADPPENVDPAGSG